MVVKKFQDYVTQSMFDERFKKNENNVIYIYITFSDPTNREQSDKRHAEISKNMEVLSDRYPSINFTSMNCDKIYWFEDRFGFFMFPVILLCKKKEVFFSLFGISDFKTCDDSVKQIFSVEPDENASPRKNIEEIKDESQVFKNNPNNADYDLKQIQQNLESAEKENDFEGISTNCVKIAEWYEKHKQLEIAKLYQERAREMFFQFGKKLASQIMKGDSRDINENIPAAIKKEPEIKPYPHLSDQEISSAQKEIKRLLDKGNEKHKDDKKLKCYQNALRIAERVGDLKCQAVCLETIADWYNQRDFKIIGDTYYQQAKAKFREIENAQKYDSGTSK